MIQNVGMSSMTGPMTGRPTQGPEGYKLTEDQKIMLDEILSRYDPENLSTEDEKNMRTEFKDAGILPGRELGTALENAGFTVRKPPPMGGPGGPPPRGPVGYELTDDQKDILDEILSKYDPKNFSTEDEDAMRTELKEAGIFPGRELGTALESAGFEIRKPHQGDIPNGIIVDNTI